MAVADPKTSVNSSRTPSSNFWVSRFLLWRSSCSLPSTVSNIIQSAFLSPMMYLLDHCFPKTKFTQVIYSIYFHDGRKWFSYAILSWSNLKTPLDFLSHQYWFFLRSISTKTRFLLYYDSKLHFSTGSNFPKWQ